MVDDLGCRVMGLRPGGGIAPARYDQLRDASLRFDTLPSEDVSRGDTGDRRAEGDLAQR